MPFASRQFADIWAGICCCHDSPRCVDMAGPIIAASEDNKSSGINKSRMSDITIGYCGHPGNIVTGAPACRSNSLGKARIGDMVVGCNIGNIVTGSARHEVANGGRP